MRYGTESFWEKMSKGRFNSVLVIGILIFASLGMSTDISIQLCRRSKIKSPPFCNFTTVGNSTD